ncbi:MAG: diol dehydratase small subunit [Rhodospirillaceae bacterium]
MAQLQNDIPPEVIEAAVKRVLSTLNGSQSATGRDTVFASNGSGKLDAKKDYPLSTKRPDLVKSATGLPFAEITLDKVAAGKLSFDDVRIRPETLEYQAQIAESGGRPHIANNLRRAAELTRIPDDRVLEIYVALRPYRSTKQELMDIAAELEGQYQAKICAKLIREAADVYEKRGRLKGQ